MEGSARFDALPFGAGHDEGGHGFGDFLDGALDVERTVGGDFREVGGSLK